jgi:hypothetical protein
VDIRDNARKWAAHVVDLHNTPVAPHLQGRKKKLMAQAQTMRRTLEAVDPLAPISPVVNELGFLPLLVIGGMAAATAMSKWAKDAYVIKKESDKYDTLVKSGLTPEQAQKVLTSSGFNWKMIVIPAGLLVGGLVLYKLVRAK